MAGKKRARPQAIDWGRVVTDVRYFVDAFLGMDLEPWQVEVLESRALSCAAAYGRGCGKSVLAVVFALWCCLRERGHVALCVSGKHQRATYAGRMLQQFISGTPLAREIKTTSDEKTEFNNGSVCYWAACSDASVRGHHNQFARRGQKIPALTCVLDECELIPGKIFRAAQGVLTASDDNRLFCVGSGGARSHWRADLWHSGSDPDSGVESFHLDTRDIAGKARFVSKKQVKQIEKQLMLEGGEHPVEMELGARFLDDAAAYFRRAHVDGCMQDYDLPAPYNPDSVYVLGCDLSKSDSGPGRTTRRLSCWSVSARSTATATWNSGCGSSRTARTARCIRT
jgi:hypothetical protein